MPFPGIGVVLNPKLCFVQGAARDPHLDFRHDGSVRLHDPHSRPNPDARPLRGLPLHGIRFP